MRRVPRASSWIRSAALAAVTTAVACAESPPNPVAPPSVPSGGSLPTVEARLLGTVYDSAFRPLSGAEIELTDRAQAWGVTTSDSQGRFEFQGWYTTSLTIRATKAGYEPATSAIDLNNHRCCEGRVTVSVTMAPVQNASLHPGPYMLTFDATDRACSFIPEHLRTQSFDAVLSNSPFGPPGVTYQLVVNSPQFYSDYFGGVTLGVAGEHLAAREEAELRWEPSPLERFEFSIHSTPFPIGPDASTLTLPASGYFCEYSSKANATCSAAPAAQVVRRGSCEARVTLRPGPH